jgi:hypothetical protein
MGASSPRPTPSPREPVGLPRPPLWLQWVLSLTIATVLIVLLVRFVDANSTPKAQAPHVSAKGQAAINAVSRIIDAQDQSPHVARIAPGTTPQSAMVAAINALLVHEVRDGTIPSPSQQTSCFQIAARGTAIEFRCSAYTGSTSYPFEGVAQRSTGTITFCKHDPPPGHGGTIPISRRCLI